MRNEQQDAVERYVEKFMSQHPIQYSLFHTPEEVEDAVRESARRGVISGLNVVQMKVDLINLMNSIW